MRAVIDDYAQRVRRHASIEVLEVRSPEAALKKLDADRAATVALLDAGGKGLDSEAFARWLVGHRDRGLRELIFLCGDADGFPEALRKRAHQRISLSAMTFSHELARAMVAEQIYRAFAILSGSPYPK